MHFIATSVSLQPAHQTPLTFVIPAAPLMFSPDKPPLDKLKTSDGDSDKGNRRPPPQVMSIIIRDRFKIPLSRQTINLMNR
jgi:hypothetical protein